MTTNTLVSIAMAPVPALEHREWAALGGCGKKHRYTPPVSRSNTHRRWRDRRSHRYAAIPPSPIPYDRSESKRSPRINHDHNRDRSGVDDGTGATGASDIRQRVDSNGIGRHHSNMASLVGNPGLRKFETHHLLSIVWALEQPTREPSIPIENIFRNATKELSPVGIDKFEQRRIK
jgi:hypothetical protein